MYCTYITIYSGNKLPPFYIGCTQVKKIYSDYRGTIKRKDYKSIFERESSLNPHLFKTKIIKVFNDPYNAGAHEKYLQQALNVGKNPLYLNKITGGNSYGHNCELKPYNSERMKLNYVKNKFKIKKRFKKNQTKGSGSARVSASKWITNGKESLRVTLSSINHYLENGYVLGRQSFNRPFVKYMHKGEHLVRVKEDEISLYLENGYEMGYSERQLQVKRETAKIAGANREAKKRAS